MYEWCFVHISYDVWNAVASIHFREIDPCCPLPFTRFLLPATLLSRIQNQLDARGYFVNDIVKWFSVFRIEFSMKKKAVSFKGSLRLNIPSEKRDEKGRSILTLANLVDCKWVRLELDCLILIFENYPHSIQMIETGWGEMCTVWEEGAVKFVCRLMLVSCNCKLFYNDFVEQ